MKNFTKSIFLIFTFLCSYGAMAEEAFFYVKSQSGLNLRDDTSTNSEVITSIPFNEKVKLIEKENDEWWKVEYNGKEGYVSAKNLSEQPSQQKKSTKNSDSSINFGSNYAGAASGYTTSIGLRGGYTSGLSFKHFIKNDAALEFVLGSRWRGLSITGLYEFHKGNAFDVPELTWVYGIGARVGFYDGRSYYGYRTRGNCNDPSDPDCDAYYNENRPITAIGIVAIGGLEYQFTDIPFTISLDIMPNIYLNYWGGNFIDGSMSLRYIIK